MIDDAVSVIIPAHNCESTIERAINSVLAQTHPVHSIIVALDHCSDKTPEIVAKMADGNPLIHLVTNQGNPSAAAARNCGLSHVDADSRFVAFLDSDDYWKPEKIERQLLFMKEKSAAFSCTSYIVRNEKTGKCRLYNPKPVLTYKKILRTCSIGCSTVIVNVKQLGLPYMPDDTKREDFATWLLLLKKTPAAFALREPLSYYAVGFESASSNKVSMMRHQWAVVRGRERTPWLIAVFCMCTWAWFGFWKYRLGKTWYE